MPADPSSHRPKLLTYRDAAKVLGISERTCATLVKKGLLRAVRIMCSVRIDMADLEAYIQGSKSGGAQ